MYVIIAYRSGMRTRDMHSGGFSGVSVEFQRGFVATWFSVVGKVRWLQGVVDSLGVSGVQ